MNANAERAVLNGVSELRAALAARADEVEQARQVPRDLIDRLRSAHLFRMFVPKRYGGREIDLLDGLGVIEELGRIDGSIAWTVMIGAQSPHLFAVLPRAEVDRIYAAGPDVIAAGAMAPSGKARPRPGGYVVDGRWSFATGCQHSDWLYGNCVVVDDRDRGRAAGQPPVLRTMVFPVHQAKIIDNWSVLGMRGSGSHDIAVEALFVPEAYSFNATACTSSIPCPHFVEPPLHIHLQLSAVAVGIAMGSIDDLMAVAASGKKRLYSQSTLAESPRFHHEVGGALAAARAARASLHELAARFWRACLADPAAARALAPEILGATSYVVRASSDVVTLCYRASGAGAIRDGSTLQRRFRDAHVMTQHIAATDEWITHLGAAALGHPVKIA